MVTKPITLRRIILALAFIAMSFGVGRAAFGGVSGFGGGGFSGGGGGGSW